MKFKLLIYIFILSNFESILQAANPTANQTSAQPLQNTPTQITLTATHNGGTGNFTFTLASTTTTQGGTITPLSQTSATNSATFTYTSPSIFIGQDTFQFHVSDSAGTSSTANVYLNVAPPSLRAYVPDFPSGTTSVINIVDTKNPTATPGSVTSLPTTYQNAYDLAITPDGTTAYVCFGDVQKVSVIDTATNTWISDISSGLNAPYAIAISPNAPIGYICNFSGSTVTKINTLTNTTNGYVTDTTPYINQPISIAFTPDGSRAYVANRGNTTVSMITISTNTAEVQISTGLAGNLHDITISPDGNFAYVVSQTGGSGSGAVYIIDINPENVGTYNTVINHIDDSLHNFSNPVAMAITPDGTKAYVANFTNSVSVINLNPGPNFQKVTSTVSGGSFNISYFVAFTADGLQAYVANYGGFVSIINASTDTVTSTISGYTALRCLAFLGAVPPTANSTTVNTITQTPIYITLSGSDSTHIPITFSIFSNPLHGTIATPISTGDFTAQTLYTPNATYTGTDAFSFKASNGGSASYATAAANIIINHDPTGTSNAANTFISDAITKYSQLK